jgi:hypothetical protein
VKTPDRFEAAMLELDCSVGELLDEVARQIEGRRTWRPWMRVDFGGRRWWVRRTDWRYLVFLRRGDAVAFADRWHE